MPLHLPRKSRSLHNFAREPPSPSSTYTIHHSRTPKRLVRKFRKSKVHLKNNFEKSYKEHVESSERSEKAVYKTSDNSDISDAETTTVPNPVPDTGIGMVSNRSSDAHHTMFRSMTPTPTAFRSLPPLLSIPTPLISSTTPIVSYTPTSTSFYNYPQLKDHQQSAHHHHLAVVIITLLAVGSAFVLVGIFIIVKACSRPKRRAHLTPSLPILAADHFEANVSPIFGGKERYSPRPGSGGLHTWTQYPQPGNVITKPARAIGYGRVYPSYDAISRPLGAGEKTTQVMTSHDTSFNEKTEYPFPGHGAATSTTDPRQASFQQVQDTVTRIASRLSTASLSIYPNSPSNDVQFGIAIEGGPPLTADGYPVIKRTKSKTTLRKSRDPESICTRYSQGLAYDGADVLSPVVSTELLPHAPSHVPSAANGGRSRVKSTYYTPGTYHRLSTAPVPVSTSTKTNHGNANPFGSQHTLRKSDSRRERDTHALTSALGLPSLSRDFTATSSPQPTLYPDDSLSVAEDLYPRKPKLGSGHSRSHKKPVLKDTGTGSHSGQDMAATIPNADTSAVLGSLMLMDYLPTSKSLAAIGTGSLGEGVACATSSSPSLGIVKSVTKKSFRTDDKPPRVPSPPPMPSLTQMGLEHRNPEAYAEYRSPTYSIYGLYESDRKSRAGSGT